MNFNKNAVNSIFAVLLMVLAMGFVVAQPNDVVIESPVNDASAQSNTDVSTSTPINEPAGPVASDPKPSTPTLIDDSANPIPSDPVPADPIGCSASADTINCIPSPAPTDPTVPVPCGVPNADTVNGANVGGCTTVDPAPIDPVPTPVDPCLASNVDSAGLTADAAADSAASDVNVGGCTTAAPAPIDPAEPTPTGGNGGEVVVEDEEEEEGGRRRPRTSELPVEELSTTPGDQIAEESNNSGLSLITGAVTGLLGEKGALGAGIFIVVLGIAGLIVYNRKH